MGLNRKIFKAQFFEDFITSVRAQSDKDLIVLKYEIRLSQIIIQHGFTISGFYQDYNCSTHLAPYDVLKNGVPFIKRIAIKTRLNSDGNIYPLYSYINDNQYDAVMASVLRFYKELHLNTHHSKYKDYYKIRFLGIPVIYILKHTSSNQNHRTYKFCIFGRIPLFKITKSV